MAKIPNGKWVHVDVFLDLGEPGMAATAPKSYRLAITVTGEKERVFEKIPYVNPDFGQVTWFGFSAADKPGGVYYVDNIRLEPIAR
jgi:hypothetical protein